MVALTRSKTNIIGSIKDFLRTKKNKQNELKDLQKKYKTEKQFYEELVMKINKQKFVLKKLEHLKLKMSNELNIIDRQIESLQ